MNTTNFAAETAPVNFYYDHLNQQIVGTRKAFDLSGNPNSPLYKELMERISGQPAYTFRVIERKKSEGKKTYEGLTYNLMIDYLDALSEEQGVKEPEQSKKIQALRDSLTQMKNDGIPFGRRKKTFLEQFPNFSVNKAKKLIEAHNFQAMKVHYKIIRLGKPETKTDLVAYNKAVNE